MINTHRRHRARVQLVYEHHGTTHFDDSRCLRAGHAKLMPRGTWITCLWCMRDWP